MHQVDASYLFFFSADVLFNLFRAARIDGVREQQFYVSIALDALTIGVEMLDAASLPCAFKDLLPCRAVQQLDILDVKFGSARRRFLGKRLGTGLSWPAADALLANRKRATCTKLPGTFGLQKHRSQFKLGPLYAQVDRWLTAAQARSNAPRGGVFGAMFLISSRCEARTARMTGCWKRPSRFYTRISAVQRNTWTV